MTDLSGENEASHSQASEAARRARLKRRLIGLAVLFFAAFLLSWLLPRQPSPEPAVPSVTIPLDATPVTAENTAPAVTPAEQARPPTTPDSPAPQSGTTAAAATLPPAKSEPTPAAPPPEPATPAAPVPPAPPVQAPPPQSRRWYVQIGSFSEPGNAQTAVNLLRKAGYRAESVPIATGGKTYHRVRLGPYSDEAAAQQALDKVKHQGYPQSRLSSETSGTDPR